MVVPQIFTMPDGAILRRQILWNCLSALVPPLLILLFWPHLGIEGIITSFLYSLVFANTIGCIASVVMPKIFMSVPERFSFRRWALAGVGLFFVAVIGCTVASVLLLLFGVTPPGEFWVRFEISIKLSILLTLFFGFGGTAYEVLRYRLEKTTLDLRTKELERERALKLATEARLCSLESRLHPHFLFNTLNSISSLIREDPARAERLVERMAALLRFSLDSAHTGVVPLETELKIVRDYLEIEKVRFGDRLHFEFCVAPGVENVEIPPLTIQTLVENSVKYAVASRREGGFIVVNVHSEGPNVHIEVIDDGPGFSVDSLMPGHGLDNLQSRLLALYGVDAALAIRRLKERMLVTVSVPARSRAAVA